MVTEFFNPTIFSTNLVTRFYIIYFVILFHVETFCAYLTAYITLTTLFNFLLNCETICACNFLSLFRLYDLVSIICNNIYVQVLFGLKKYRKVYLFNIVLLLNFLVYCYKEPQVYSHQCVKKIYRSNFKISNGRRIQFGGEDLPFFQKKFQSFKAVFIHNQSIQFAKVTISLILISTIKRYDIKVRKIKRLKKVCLILSFINLYNWPMNS